MTEPPHLPSIEDFTVVQVDSSAPRSGYSTATSARSRYTRRRRKPAFPTWGWLLLGLGLGISTVGLVVFAMWEPSELLSPPPPSGHANGSDEPVPGDVVSVPGVKVAKSAEEFTEAVVRLIIRKRNGDVGVGSGFFIIDNRGWVATNYHVIEGAMAGSRAETATGQKYELVGIVDKAPDHDLAIVKVKDPPAEITVLDISFREEFPEAGQDVWAIGHPDNNRFMVTKGSLARVVTSRALYFENPVKYRIIYERKLSWDLLLIQHDAKTLKGSSGGPLVNKKGRVLGVNSFGDQHFGCAVHVRHLAGMAEFASEDDLEPLR